MTDTHRLQILDQFTRQAVPFNSAPVITNERPLQMLLEATGPEPSDTVLDVACGGGIVACAFAPYVRRAVGMDLTPAMLAQARQLAADRKLTNVTFESGDAASLPYPDATFNITCQSLFPAPYAGAGRSAA
jgi:ubiquinone/menaquinone biosynthesis C-methylase UbiE